MYCTYLICYQELKKKKASTLESEGFKCEIQHFLKLKYAAVGERGEVLEKKISKKHFSKT